MKLECLFVGKTSKKYIGEGIQVYLKRLKHYIVVDIKVISNSSVGTQGMVVKKESEQILKMIGLKDFVVLLDERGKEIGSVQLADFINKSMVEGTVKIIFIIGGAYGVSQDVADRANLKLSFSKFTFTHQMIRLFLLEQIYRAMTIIRKEPYHHS